MLGFVAVSSADDDEFSWLNQWIRAVQMENLEERLQEMPKEAEVKDKSSFLDKINDISMRLTKTWGQLDREDKTEKNFLEFALKEVSKFKERLLEERRVKLGISPSEGERASDLLGSAGGNDQPRRQPLPRKTSSNNVDEQAIERLRIRDESFSSIQTRTSELVKGLLFNEIKELALVMAGLHVQQRVSGLSKGQMMASINGAIMIKVVEFLVGVFIDLLSAVFGRKLQIGEAEVASSGTTARPHTWLDEYWMD